VVSAFVIRDGLLAIAAAVREKELPDVTVSELTVEHASVIHQPQDGSAASGVNLTIENMTIDVPVKPERVKFGPLLSSTWSQPDEAWRLAFWRDTSIRAEPDGGTGPDACAPVPDAAPWRRVGYP
jgi:hypothetical protein